jgi:hypothetical protein
MPKEGRKYLTTSAPSFEVFRSKDLRWNLEENFKRVCLLVYCVFPGI